MAGGMQNLMRQANQLQIKIKKLQEELAEREYESSSGGGAVAVKVKGESQLTSLKISEDVMKSGDVDKSLHECRPIAVSFFPVAWEPVHH